MQFPTKCCKKRNFLKKNCRRKKMSSMLDILHTTSFSLSCIVDYLVDYLVDYVGVQQRNKRKV